jgi:hypothetical protein
MLTNYLAKTLTRSLLSGGLLSGGMYFYLNPQSSHALPPQSPILISSLDAAGLYARGLQRQKQGYTRRDL